MTKYKNLNILKEITKDMNNVSVPSFYFLDFTYFDLYTSYNDKELEKRLKQFYKDHIKTGGSYILRSSALKSEDGDVMGAGLYESKELDENTFECFFETIIFIYKSFYSPHAIKERERQKVKDDKMEIILQDYVGGYYCNYNNNEAKGFCNSILQGNKNIIHIDIHNHPVLINKKGLTQTKRKTFGDMEEMFFRCDDNDKYREMFACPYDIYKVGAIPFIELGYIVEDIKKEYKKEFQIEFSYDREKFHIYQIRPLPKIYEKEISIELPKEKELFSLDCPFKKAKTKVYPSHFKYSYPSRFYMMNNSYSASVQGSYYLEKFEENLPEVLCFQEHSLIDHWHLQSIALQKNKLVLEAYPNGEKINQLKELQSFYIVADWKKIRFYENTENEPIDEKRVLAFIKGTLDGWDYSNDDKIIDGSKVLEGKSEHRYFVLKKEFEKEFEKFEKEDIDVYLCDFMVSDKEYNIEYKYWKFYITDNKK